MRRVADTAGPASRDGLPPALTRWECLLILSRAVLSGTRSGPKSTRGQFDCAAAAAGEPASIRSVKGRRLFSVVAQLELDATSKNFSTYCRRAPRAIDSSWIVTRRPRRIPPCRVEVTAPKSLPLCQLKSAFYSDASRHFRLQC